MFSQNNVRMGICEWICLFKYFFPIETTTRENILKTRVNIHGSFREYSRVFREYSRFFREYSWFLP